MLEYNIKVELKKNTSLFLSPKNQDIISASNINTIFDLPTNYSSGICNSFASITIDGSIEQIDSMDLNDDLKEEVFTLLYVASSRSNLKIVLGELLKNNLCNNQLVKYQK